MNEALTAAWEEIHAIEYAAGLPVEWWERSWTCSGEAARCRRVRWTPEGREYGEWEYEQKSYRMRGAI